MPRTASFDLSEIKTTSKSSITPVYTSNPMAHINSRNIPQDTTTKENKGCGISCGWCVGLCMCACCVTFFVLLFLFPHDFIPELVNIDFDRPLLIQKGYLRVYPNLPQFSTEADRIPGVYVIDPSLEHVTTTIIPNMENILNLYSEREPSDRYPPRPYILCWLENPSNSNVPCYFDRNWLLSDCNEDNKYGYQPINGHYNPCVLLRLENTDNWIPKIFHISEVDQSWIAQYDASHVAVGCHAAIQQDTQININIHPNKGFPIHFFPQSSFEEDTYLAPMVMIQIKNLEIGRNYSINCWIRAQNSWYLKDSGMVTIHFRYSYNTNTNFQKKTLNISNILRPWIESN